MFLENLVNPTKSNSQFTPEQIQHTNLVIEEIDPENDKITYYIPAYVRLKIKNILDVDLSSLNALILATITVTISIRGFKQYIITKYNKNRYQHIYTQLTSNIMLMFNKDQALIIRKDSDDLNIRYKQNEQQITFNIWKIIQLNVIPRNYWLHPFELIDLCWILNLATIKTQHDGTNINLKFNCMDTKNQFVKISYNPDMLTFGQYTLARGLLNVIYYNKKSLKNYKSILPQQQQFKQTSSVQHFKMLNRNSTTSTSTALMIRVNYDKSLIQTQTDIQVKKTAKVKIFKEYQYCHFIIPIYRKPIVDLLTIFIPLWLLGLLNIFIFFQDNALGDRVANIGGIMIAFAALIPTIRDKIPPAPQLTLVEILIYVEISTCILAMVQSYLILNIPASTAQNSSSSSGNDSTSNNSNQTLNNGSIDQGYNWRRDSLYWVTIAINLVIFLIVIIMFIIFYTLKRPKFDKVKSQQNEQLFSSDDKSLWRQKACDIQFNSYRRNCHNKSFHMIKNHITMTKYEQ